MDAPGEKSPRTSRDGPDVDEIHPAPPPAYPSASPPTPRAAPAVPDERGDGVDAEKARGADAWNAPEKPELTNRSLDDHGPGSAEEEEEVSSSSAASRDVESLSNRLDSDVAQLAHALAGAGGADGRGGGKGGSRRRLGRGHCGASAGDGGGDERGGGEAGGGDGGLDTNEDEMRSVLRKIDWVLLPTMSVVYILTFLDKTTTNYANLLGFTKDLDFTVGQYSWLGSIFYFGYLFATPLHGVMFQKLPLGPYVACVVCAWGVVLALHAACFNYASLVVCRLFLGIFEAAVTPGFILLTGRFYRRDEQVSRTAFWFSMNGWAQVVGGILAYGVLGQKPGPLATWREMFVILGAITFFFGVVTLFLFPSSPETFKLLTPRERLVAVERVRSNNSGLHSRRFRPYQLREALVGDPRLLLLFLCITTLDIANGGTTNFGSSIIASLGYDRRITALLGMAAGFSEVVATLAVVLVERHSRSRAAAGVTTLLVAVCGAAMMVGLPPSQAAARMAGYCLVMWFAMASLILYSILSTSSVAGETKRITFNVVFQVGYAAGNIIGPQTYRASDAPEYARAKVVLLACLVAGLGFFCLLFLYHLVENKRRDRLYGARRHGGGGGGAPKRRDGADADGRGGQDEEEEEQDEEARAEFQLADLTDRERTSFRYPL